MLSESEKWFLVWAKILSYLLLQVQLVAIIILFPDMPKVDINYLSIAINPYKYRYQLFMIELHCVNVYFCHVQGLIACR